MRAVKLTLVRFRRMIRPVVLPLIRALPSPEGCGCASRKARLIAYIESI